MCSKRSVSGLQRDEKQTEDKEQHMECQCQVTFRVSEEQTTTAGAMARPKSAMSPEHKEKDGPSARQDISRIFTESKYNGCFNDYSVCISVINFPLQCGEQQ